MAGFVAFIDESQSYHELDPDVYLLAAVVVEESMIAEIRNDVAGLARRGQGKLHWSHESDHRRRIITRVMAELPVRHIVVVQLCHPDARQERRRRLCMERLFHELDGEISRAIFESRGRKDDFRDRELIKALHDSKHLATRPHIDHRRGTDDPMLWIPDAVCGAVTRHRTGTPAYLDHLTEHSSITVITNDRPH